MHKPKMIVFMGGQGSGKGTFSKLLMQQKHYNYLETGEIYRQMPDESNIKQKISHGELIDDNDLFPIIAPLIIPNTDIILDGFPRTIGQARWLVENYSDKFNITVIFLDIKKEKMLAHIKKRIKQGHIRVDDTDESAINKRIESFEKITMPAIKMLSRSPNVHFYDIKLSSDDIDTNFKAVSKVLN